MAARTHAGAAPRPADPSVAPAAGARTRGVPLATALAPGAVSAEVPMVLSIVLPSRIALGALIWAVGRWRSGARAQRRLRISRQGLGQPAGGWW